MKNNRGQSGLGVIEILIVVAIIGIAMGSLVVLENLALDISGNQGKNLQATNLATEAIEASRAVKEENWAVISGLNQGAPYHLTRSGTPLKWALAEGEETAGQFTRQIVFSDVYRNDNDDIVENGGILDPETRKVSVIVSWNYKGDHHQVLLSAYLTNWK